MSAESILNEIEKEASEGKRFLLIVGPIKEWRKAIFNHPQLIRFLVPLADGM